MYSQVRVLVWVLFSLDSLFDTFWMTMSICRAAILGCLLQITSLKAYTRGDRFLYYKASRASTVTVVRKLTEEELQKSLAIYEAVISDNPRTLDSLILGDATPSAAANTTILRLRHQNGKSTWVIRAIIIDVHFLMLAVKCSFCQTICDKQFAVRCSGDWMINPEVVATLQFSTNNVRRGKVQQGSLAGNAG